MQLGFFRHFSFCFSLYVNLDPMFYDDLFTDVSRGLGVWGLWYTEKAVSQEMGLGTSGKIRTL